MPVDPAEQKRNEATRARLAAIVTSSIDAITGETLDGIITDWNPAAERLYGYTAAEAIGQPLTMLAPPGGAGEIDDLLERVRRGESIAELKTIRRTRDGRLIDVSVTISPVRDDAGQVIAASAITRDVTASRQLAQTLHASETRHRTLIDHLPAVIYLLAADEAQTAIYISPRLEALTGYRPEEALARHGGWHWIETIHPEDRDRVAAEDARTVAAGETFRMEYRYVRKDGSYVWVLDECVPVHDDAGQIVAWQGVLLDISERVQAESTLRASEARFRAVWDTTADAIALSNPAGVILAANPAYCALFGYPPDAVIGQHFSIMFPEAEREAVRAHYHDVFSSADPQLSYVATVQRADGTRLEVEENLAFIAVDGVRQAMISSIRDVTERIRLENELRASEAKFRSLADHLPALVYVMMADERQTPVYFSPYLEELTGYRPEEALAREGHWLDGVHPDDRDRVAAEDARSVATGEPLRIEYRYQRKDGSYIWVLDDSVALRDETGAIVALQGVLLDISERVRAEAALRLRDRALAATTNGIVITDPTLPDNPIVDVNLAFETLTGYTRQEVMGRNCRFLQGQDTDPAAVRRIREAIAAGRDVTETLLNSRKDGTPFWNELHVSAVRDEAGRLTHFVGVLTDVTERMETETALIREYGLLQTVLETLPDAVYVKDTASRFVRLNDATARLLGITNLAEAVGKTDRDFFPETQAAEYAADERRLFATGKPMLSKLQRQLVAGDERWVLATKAPLRDAGGEIIGLVGLNRDVTERLQTEEARARLAAIVESAEDAIISRTLEGTITSWNRGAETLYGYAADEAIGRSFTMLLPDDEQPAAQAETEQFGAPATRFETKRRRQDGTMVDVSVAMSPIRDDTGVTIGVSTITRDVTERKQFEAELRAALEGAQAATRTKSLFLAMMSHELRTPLQAVLGYADLLLLGPEGSLTEEQTEDLGYIQGGAARMIALIDQMLDLSRMEAGRLDLAEEPVDLVGIIEQVR